MKHICFDSIRQSSKWENVYQRRSQKNQLDPSWYTDNIYSNQSEDLDDDYMPDFIKYNTYQKLRNIRENDEFYNDQSPLNAHSIDDVLPYSKLNRSISCRELSQYPKAQTYFHKNTNRRDDALKHASILRNSCTVPKSYSFSATTKTTPFDVIDYEMKLPPLRNTRRDRHNTFPNVYGYHYGSASFDESKLSNIHLHDVHSCCTREFCTNPKCLLNDIYPQSSDMYRRNLPVSNAAYNTASNDDCKRNLYLGHNYGGANRRYRASYCTNATCFETARKYEPHLPLPLQQTMVLSCHEDSCCCQRRKQRYSKLRCPKYHPAAEEEEHLHYHHPTYDTSELEYFINSEREQLQLQDKYLDEDEQYLNSSNNNVKFHSDVCCRYPRKVKAPFLEPPSQFDDDSCSDSTEIDLQDFNIDLEKYWEELDKPPSPIDHDMQQRNMQSNLKVKNINVARYNNGKPKNIHDREQERLIIKKSLFEGMPSPPQIPISDINEGHPNNLPLFEDSNSPLHHNTYKYGYKVYPFTQNLPSYKYNNFYPEHNAIETEQPFTERHPPSVNGASNSALSLINNIFSIYKPNKYSSTNCQMNSREKPELCKKMNVPSTRRPLGAPHSEYMHSMKRPLIVSNEQPHFKIIPEKTGLKISPLYNFDDFNDNPQMEQKLSSTARPLMLPH